MPKHCAIFGPQPSPSPDVYFQHATSKLQHPVLIPYLNSRDINSPDLAIEIGAVSSHDARYQRYDLCARRSADDWYAPYSVMEIPAAVRAGPDILPSNTSRSSQLTYEAIVGVTGRFALSRGVSGRRPLGFGIVGRSPVTLAVTLADPLTPATPLAARSPLAVRVGGWVICRGRVWVVGDLRLLRLFIV